MTPEEFVAKYRGATLNEQKFYQSHFNDLCRVLEVPDPVSADKHGTDYCFEKNVLKLGGAAGRADVWKRGHFAWEYKGSKKNLTAAYAQVKQYADALDNPPLLIVSDSQEIRIHTNFTNSVSVTHTIPIGALNSVESRRLLRWCWTDPEKLRPTETRATVTDKAAKVVGAIASNLRRRLGEGESRRIAHFLNRIVFCLFAEDIELLPNRLFSDLLEDSLQDPDGFVHRLRNLFRAMKDRDGFFGNHRIPWFNGGLFDDDDVIDLHGLQIRDLFEAAKLDWAAIEPSIFGTLFERGLDPEKRKAMAGLFDLPDTVADAMDPDGAKPAKGAKGKAGAKAGKVDKGVGIHYTDPDKIMKIVEPVVLRPLRTEWEQVKAQVADHRAKRDAAKTDSARTKHEDAARTAYLKFRARLGQYRVLDPACGSGNFLYMALMHLKDLDRAIEAEARTLGLPADGERVTPQCVLGIEINPYAAELARTTVWIGELQWQMKNAGAVKRAPILGRLDGIEEGDALLKGGKERQWPKADAIVGNPPFLGTKRLLDQLGADYVGQLRTVYDGRVPQEADLVTFWVAKAGEAVSSGTTRTAGLVTTNSIRGGASRKVVAKLLDHATLYDVWDDEEWDIEGAAVRVSLFCFARKDDPITSQVRLDGLPALEIYADLTGRRRSDEVAVDLTQAKRLSENQGIAFMGDTKGGAFDIPGDLARKWLQLPLNPNGRPNSDVLRPWVNGLDITRRNRDMWIIDFGTSMTEREASFYEAPFKHIQEFVRPEREKNKREHYREFWWRHVEPRPGYIAAVQELQKHLITPRVSAHRIFRFIEKEYLADSATIIFSKDDYLTLGILQSRFHEAWSLRMGTSLEDRPRYTPTTCFETFPFPEGLTPDIPAEAYASDPRAQAIAEAARDLDEARERWLNPPDLIRVEPEVVPGYPDRILPRNDKAAAVLKQRTLTKLYNERPAWLANLHEALDRSVAAAYGWPVDIRDEEVLAQLFALNQQRKGIGE